MKTIIYSLLSLVVICSSCKGQNEKNKENKTTVITKNNESPGKPKVDIQVNKTYDNKGNLISYDSTYTSYYSSRKGDRLLMDSLLNEFKPAFSKKFPMINDQYFDNLFFNDSLIYNDFFHEDFFKNRLKLNEKYMNKMMEQMDSVKNEFFRKQSKQLKK